MRLLFCMYSLWLYCVVHFGAVYIIHGVVFIHLPKNTKHLYYLGALLWVSDVGLRRMKPEPRLSKACSTYQLLLG